MGKKFSKYWQRIGKVSYVYSDNIMCVLFFFFIPGDLTSKLLEIITELNSATRNKTNRQPSALDGMCVFPPEHLCGNPNPYCDGIRR